METKKCSSCGNELPISQFHKNAAAKDVVYVIDGYYIADSLNGPCFETSARVN